ncbi:SDR family oxidoreductase [Bacillus sp. A301a_S52]|jgi:3-oxoacyl-[acyl-carrier protein] reductase|nr:SDR family oxidoreductase [Bacillus sp. A301a_S52]
MDLGLQGKNVLVLASSKGLGKAVAKAYADSGANVMITSRDVTNAKAAAEELATTAEGKIDYLPCDVTMKEDVKRLVEETAARLGGIDVLVNNAGGPPPGTFESVTEEEWAKGYDLTLMSTVRAIKHALPYLKQSKGKIITITSASMKEPIDGLLLSNVYRMGIVGLSKTLAKEFAPYGVLINTVGPGRISTDRLRTLDEARAEKTGESVEKVKETIEASIPLGRYGEPEEFAKTILFLGSDLNTYVTGQMFVVDGGMTSAY